MKHLMSLMVAGSVFGLAACVPPSQETVPAATDSRPDTFFLQAYSVKFTHPQGADLFRAGVDRNGNVRVIGEAGLLRPDHGAFLYPGTLQPDRSYRAMDDLRVRDLALHQGQFLYLTDSAVLSNAWAGRLYRRHVLPGARRLRVGADGALLIATQREVALFLDGAQAWRNVLPEDILDLQWHPTDDNFWVLTPKTLYAGAANGPGLRPLLEGENLSAVAWYRDSLIVADREGYFTLDPGFPSRAARRRNRVPALPINCLAVVHGALWFGSDQGAYRLRADEGFDYYQGRRWLPDDAVHHIAPGPRRSVLVLTRTGLGQIAFKPMTLADKAAYFERQVRQRHIRYGLNATWSGMKKGDLSTGYLSDSDNDGLWTGMYLAGQAFRYAVTGAPEALQNCRESLSAMERLFSLNPVRGFPSRSFERRGQIARLADPERWQSSPDPNWDWKATTSSDEAIGHLFAYGVVADVVDDEEIRALAVALIDSLMTHIVDHDLFLVDHDGKPTTWGRWNPSYVNALPPMVGDRKLNSSNIISMLQTAFHYTGKEKFRSKAVELMREHGYLDNLMRPMREIGPAPDTADDWSRMLSGTWNHSDDEMYFLGYWGLYRYAFNDSLKAMYRKAILDHWAIERPEKEGAWNILTAITGAAEVGLDEAIWYLQEYPLDLIAWDVRNSHRRDLNFLEPNFRGQTTAEVLPPDERPIRRHNANTFQLDQIGRDGTREYSAGDIWLLPYWMGRYLGVIRPPPTAE